MIYLGLKNGSSEVTYLDNLWLTLREWEEKMRTQSVRMFIYEENQFNSIQLNIHETYIHRKYCINIETDSTPTCSKVISQWKKKKKYTSNVAHWKLVRWNYGYDSTINRFLFVLIDRWWIHMTKKIWVHIQ